MPMNSLHDIPGTHTDTVYVPAIASSDADSILACWIAPFTALVTGFKYVSTIAVTGADTNSVTLDVTGVNAATTVRATHDLDSGSDLVALVDISMTMTTAAGFNVAAGDVLSLRNDEVGTGLGAAVGPGTWVIEYRGR